VIHIRTRSINILLWFLSGVCLFVQSCNSPTSVQTHNYDMFPLRNGLQYKYSYSHIITAENNKWIDSGFVEYEIKYSKDVLPTLRVWIIGENVNLLHQYYVPNDQFGGMRLDSSYLVNYYATDSLKENLYGSHILSCQSLIWQFPLGIISEGLEPFARYSSSFDSVLSYNYTFDSGPGSTVEHYQNWNQKHYVFEKDKGLISASYDVSSSSMVSSNSSIIRATLLNYSQKYRWQGNN
jgi:hypothetical protein